MNDAELLAIIAQAEREGWTELDLSGNNLEGLPSEIGRLQSLEKLILGKFDYKEGKSKGNRLTSIPQEIFQLTNLKELSIAFNQITVIPDAIAQLANLTTLSLHSNKITTIPDVIAQLSNLTDINLSFNKITTIPDAIAQLSNLTDINLSFNQITTIPDAIAQLANLTTLFLHSNKITTIPDAITQLSVLTTLSLHSNKITTIPDAITQLSNLTTLSLHSNKITTIPDAITQLSNLTTLSLHSNKITTIPDAITQLSNLTTLYLSNNQITAIPDAIAQLANLTTLSLSSNQITAIPDAIAQLANLTEINLYDNQITAIPDVIGQLANLIEIDVSHNQIKEITEQVFLLPKLQKFKLDENKLLLELTTLYAKKNNLDIPPEIFASSYRNGQQPFSYLRQLILKKNRPLHEAKLSLVGQGSVGKTSLMERLIHDRYDKNQSQTDGLNVETWNVQVNSKDIRLNVWDFGGQEIYHATHQFFLTKRSLYLLVCNCRTSEEENRIEYWLKLIESFGGKSPVIIVGNKKDEQPLDINRKALREKYPNIQAIIETSCQDNIGIDELRAAILQQVGKLKEVYDLLPLSWFEVKQQLESMPEDFITYNRYLNICHENKIPDEQNQEQLIDLLHSLGLVLNYRDHPILKDTNVLKPNWVTEGIYALLSDETLKTDNKGIFTLADLSRVLNPERYPSDRHNYLIELMKEFELCFDIDCNPKQFLIPAILPKDEPAETELEGDTLEFQYHYRILPNSIISRFIVNTSDYIHNQTYWRSGVMMAYPKPREIYNIARIKADTEDTKIFITISGRKETRREFLAIIREELNKIHKNFSNLDITEWVTIPEYPDIEPLNHQDLLIAEAEGESTVFVAKIRKKIDISKLLDGYVSKIVREEKVYIEKQVNNYYQYGQGDNFAGDEVEGNKFEL
jgi:internalin A